MHSIVNRIVNETSVVGIRQISKRYHYENHWQSKNFCVLRLVLRLPNLSFGPSTQQINNRHSKQRQRPSVCHPQTTTVRHTSNIDQWSLFVGSLCCWYVKTYHQRINKFEYTQSTFFVLK